MKKELSVLFLTVFLAGCSGDEKKNDLYFKNDFESSSGWCDLHALAKADAHSGHYITRTDTVNQYSATFSKKLSEISSKPLKGIDVSAWVMFRGGITKGDLVVSIDKDGKVIFYSGINCNDLINKQGEWVQVKGTLAFPPNMDPDAILKFYMFNTGKSEMDGDDFEIQFYN
jgi:hypothetical protein